MTMRCRTLFLSDCHLGSNEAQAVHLARFLKAVECEELYLVGDIIDFASLRQRWHWPDAHNTVLRRVLKMSHRGTRVVYVPGDRDDAARRWCGRSLGGIEVALEAEHRTRDGRRLLVTHGDTFDLVARVPWLQWVARALGEGSLLSINRGYRAVRRAMGALVAASTPPTAARTARYSARFEHALASEARKLGFDGVVCGHLHKAGAREIEGLAYFNCGEWVDGCTALLEHEDGRLELVDGMALLARFDAEQDIRRELRAAQREEPHAMDMRAADLESGAALDAARDDALDDDAEFEPDDALLPWLRPEIAAAIARSPGVTGA